MLNWIYFSFKLLNIDWSITCKYILSLEYEKMDHIALFFFSVRLESKIVLPHGIENET